MLPAAWKSGGATPSQVCRARSKFNQEQVAEALEESVRAIVHTVRSVLERTPPELSADIMDKGIVLTGGGALLEGFASLMTERPGIPCHLADDPMSCVATGTGRVLGRAWTSSDENALIVASRSLKTLKETQPLASMIGVMCVRR